MMAVRVEPGDAGSLLVTQRGAPTRQRLDSDNTYVLDHTTPKASIYPWARANTILSQFELPFFYSLQLINGFCQVLFSKAPSVPTNLKAACHVLSTPSDHSPSETRRAKWTLELTSTKPVSSYPQVYFNFSFSLPAVTSPPGLKPWKGQTFKFCLKAISRLFLSKSAFVLFSHLKKSVSIYPTATGPPRFA